MKETDALVLFRQLLEHSSLNDLDEAVFRFSWQGLSYPQISKQLGYDSGYIRGVGFQLWRNLSDACGQRVTKKNVKSIFEQRFERPHAHPAEQPTPPGPGKAHFYPGHDYPRPLALYGRTSELDNLQRWIVSERRGLVAIVGEGGIGKTEIAAYVAQVLWGHFQRIFWCSLHNAPPLELLLARIFESTLNTWDADCAPPSNGRDLTADLIHLLKKQRCLLILDHIDAVLGQGSVDDRGASGQNRSAFENLLHQLSRTPHQSCLLLIGRQMTAGLNHLCRDHPTVPTLALEGLSPRAGRAALEDRGVYWGNSADWQGLIQRCKGNPLTLKITGAVVQHQFNGELRPYLNDPNLMFQDLNDLLNQQFNQLPQLEQRVMYWLALERQPVSLETLTTIILPGIPQQQIFSVLKDLLSRALICKQSTSFTQPLAVMEFCTEKLCRQFSQELMSGHPDFLIHYALVRTQGSTMVQNIQQRLLINPILQRLARQLSSPAEVHRKIFTIRLKFQQEKYPSVGHGINNLEALSQAAHRNLNTPKTKLLRD